MPKVQREQLENATATATDTSVTPYPKNKKTKTKPETLLETIERDNYEREDYEITIIKDKRFGKAELDFIIGRLMSNNIYSLNLDQLKLDDDAICSLSDAIKFNTSLENLSLCKNKFGNRGIIAILSAVKNHPSIISLDISKNSFDDYDEKNEINIGFIELIRNNKIEILDINNTNITDTLAIAISTALLTNTSITYFNCKDCNIGEIGTYRLALAIHSNKNISSFEILQKDRFTYDIFIILCDIWKRDNYKKEINLSFYKFVKDSFIRLLAVLKTNHNIIDINISYNHSFTPDLTKRFLNFLPNTNIKKLKLAGQRFNDECEKFLGNLIYYQDNLLSLDVCNCEISTNGYNYIGYALQKNTSILDYNVFRLPGNVQAGISQFISRNVLLRDNQFWSPRIHLDFKQYNKYRNLEDSDYDNKKIDDLVITTLLCINASKFYVPIEVICNIFSFYTRKMFY